MCSYCMVGENGRGSGGGVVESSRVFSRIDNDRACCPSIL